MKLTLLSATDSLATHLSSLQVWAESLLAGSVSRQPCICPNPCTLNTATQN